MAAGLQVSAQDGSDVLQIDDSSLNLFLKQKGTITSSILVLTNGDGQQTSMGYLDIANVQQGFPIVAISSSQLSSCGPSSLGNGNWRLYFYMAGPVGSSVDFWVFDTLSGDPSTFGFQLWNAQGKLQYDGSKKPLRVIDVLSGISSGTSSESRQYNPSSKYAVVFSGGGASRSFEGTQIPGGPSVPPFYILFSGGAKVDSGRVTLGTYQTYSGNGTISTYGKLGYGLVADVTNY